MVTQRTCTGLTKNGDRCGAPPTHDGDFCFWHSPEHAEEAAAARKLGGQRRRRESTLAGAYEVGPLDNVGGIRRVLEIVIFDALGMETGSVARGRLLIAGTQALTKLLEVGELEERLAAVEAALKPRLVKTGGRR
jgi:hypothetical protein